MLPDIPICGTTRCATVIHVTEQKPNIADFVSHPKNQVIFGRVAPCVTA
jgi:hypothetical protein